MKKIDPNRNRKDPCEDAFELDGVVETPEHYDARIERLRNVWWQQTDKRGKRGGVMPEMKPVMATVLGIPITEALWKLMQEKQRR